MPGVTDRAVRKIADLAHLRFTAEELEPFARQFQEILDYIAQLETVATEGVEPSYHALQEDGLATPVRPDQARPSLPVEVVMKNAPDASEDHFRVPAVIEDQE